MYKYSICPLLYQSEKIMKKYKRDSAEQTISVIRKILHDIGLLLYESHNIHQDYYSCRVSIGNKGLIPLNIGTNGKGRTFEYSLASGYAEFMERLQNNLLLNAKKMLTSKTYDVHSLVGNKEDGEFSYSSDETRTKIKDMEVSFYTDLVKMCGSESVVNSFIKNKNYETIFIPFADVTMKRILNLPINLLLLLTGSNGMASGNSPKEAMLQAICEIFERYVISEIYWNELTPPTIPLSSFKDSEIGVTLIRYKEMNNYDIIIKDCSLGLGIPAIGLIIIDRNNYAYNFKIGVDFVQTIALERCFTEVHQGRDSFQRLPYSFIKTKNINEKEKVIAEDNLMKIFVNGTGLWPISIMGNTDTYKPSSFNAILGESNVYDLDYSLSLIQKLGFNVYIRKNSVLGFPTYYIVVPGMSQIIKRNPFKSDFTQSIRDLKYINNLGRINHDIAEKILIAIEENYAAMKKNTFELKRIFVFNVNTDINELSVEMLASLLSIYLGKYDIGISYLEKYLEHKDKVEYVYYYACLFYLKEKNSGNDAESLTRNLYGKERAEEIIKDLSAPKDIFQYYKLPNCPFCKDCLLKDDCKQKEMDAIQKRIMDKWIANRIDQRDIFAEIENGYE